MTSFLTAIKPLQLTTAEFGFRWGKLKFELKKSVPMPLMTVEQLCMIMPAYLHKVS